MVTVLSTVVVLGVLIFVHELGHFLVAKALGVRVERFSLGFPPRMIGKKIGETEYLISWVPLGGYVRMFGENPEEEVPPQEQDRSFSHKPARVRFLIVLAGPAFNFFFAVLIFWVVFAAHGLFHLSTEVGQVQEGMPAAEAGLAAGDKIVAIDGRPVKYWEDLQARIQEAEGRPVELLVERGARRLTLRLEPRLTVQKDIFGQESPVPMIGIVAQGNVVVEPVNPAAALYYGVAKTWDLTRLTIISVVRLIQRKISIKTLGGPIFIAQLAGQQAQAGLLNLIFLTALLSVNLGILNALPIPVLDGGHLFFFGVEMIFRKPVSLRVREKAQQAGLVFLILFMVFIFYNDLTRLFSR